jgi:hypothetical protein
MPNDESYNAWLKDKSSDLDYRDWLKTQPSPLAPAAAPAPVNALAAAPAAAAPAVSSKADQIRAEITDLRTRFPYSAKAKEQITFLNKELEQLTKAYTVGSNLVSGEGTEIYKGKEKPAAPPVSIAEYERAKTDPAFMNFLRERAAATRAPVVVKPMGSGIGKSAAPAPKPMTELQQQAFRKAMAADKVSVKNSQSVVGELEKLTDELVGNPEKGIRPDPGLSGISGYQALLPSLPKSDARKAQQKLETMKGKVMAFGRQLASLEGKLGNMAVQEWKFVSDSIQSIDPAAGNLDEQLRDIVRQAKSFADTVQERYDLTYEGAEDAPPRTGGTAPVAGGKLSPAEQAELDQLRLRFKKNTP